MSSGKLLTSLATPSSRQHAQGRFRLCQLLSLELTRPGTLQFPTPCCRPGSEL